MSGPYGTAFLVLLLFTLLLITLLPRYFRWEQRRAAAPPEELAVLKEATRNFSLAPDAELGCDVWLTHEDDSHE